MEDFVLKIFTLNLRTPLKVGSYLLKFLAFVTVIALSVHFSSKIFANADYYVDTLNELTDNSTIIIDAGHGGEDCGAIGVNGRYEKDLNFEIANMLGGMLSEKGFAVVYTRTEDKLLYTEEENIKGLRKIYDLKNRCKIGKEYENSIFVSIHMNSFTNEKYSGLQVYFSQNNENSRTLAESIQTSVREEVQNENNRQIKPGSEMYLLKNLDNPAVLIECGFMTNREECQKLSQKEYQKELCFAIICGIINYKNIV